MGGSLESVSATDRQAAAIACRTGEENGSGEEESQEELTGTIQLKWGARASRASRLQFSASRRKNSLANAQPFYFDKTHADQSAGRRLERPGRSRSHSNWIVPAFR